MILHSGVSRDPIRAVVHGSFWVVSGTLSGPLTWSAMYGVINYIFHSFIRSRLADYNYRFKFFFIPSYMW